MEKIAADILSSEDITKITVVERLHRKVRFTAPSSLFADGSIKEPDVMKANGFNPAGYGQPFDSTTVGECRVFYCWGSCD